MKDAENGLNARFFYATRGDSYLLVSVILLAFCIITFDPLTTSAQCFHGGAKSL